MAFRCHLIPAFNCCMRTGLAWSCSSRPACSRRRRPESTAWKCGSKPSSRQREGKTGNIYLGVPHRLDRPVSGRMVFARNVRAAQRLSKQFERARSAKDLLGAGRGSRRSGRGNLARHAVESSRPAAVAGRVDGLILAADRRCCITARWGRAARIVAGDRAGDRPHASSAASKPPREGMPCWATPITDHDSFGPAVRRSARSGPIALHGRRLSFLHPMTRAAGRRSSRCRQLGRARGSATGANRFTFQTAVR